MLQKTKYTHYDLPVFKIKNKYYAIGYLFKVASIMCNNTDKYLNDSKYLDIIAKNSNISREAIEFMQSKGLYNDIEYTMARLIDCNIELIETFKADKFLADDERYSFDEFRTIYKLSEKDYELLNRFCIYPRFCKKDELFVYEIKPA